MNADMLMSAMVSMQSFCRSVMVGMLQLDLATNQDLSLRPNAELVNAVETAIQITVLTAEKKMTVIEHHSLDHIKTFFRICREDLSHALCEMGRGDLRIQGTIEMITELLDDHVYWESFKVRWNVPWEETYLSRSKITPR